MILRILAPIAVLVCLSVPASAEVLMEFTYNNAPKGYVLKWTVDADGSWKVTRNGKVKKSGKFKTAQVVKLIGQLTDVGLLGMDGQYVTGFRAFDYPGYSIRLKLGKKDKTVKTGAGEVAKGRKKTPKALGDLISSLGKQRDKLK